MPYNLLLKCKCIAERQGTLKYVFGSIELVKEL